VRNPVNNLMTIRKLMILASTFLFAACTQQPSTSLTAEAQAAPPSGLKTFTLRIPGEPETLDWNLAHTPIETYILMNIMEGLVTFDAQMKVIPSLAKNWLVSRDGLTYTFKLRDDVKWSDGVPLKAADFVYSWKRLLSPLTAASYAYFLFDVEGAEAFNKGTIKDFAQVGVKALNDRTLQVKLLKPVAHWISIPTFWVTFPLREDMVAKHGTGWAKPGAMLTLGPYMLAAHDMDSKIILKANPTYYGKRGNIDQVVALIVNDASTAMTLYEAGKIDFLTDISTLDLKRMAGNKDLKRFPYLKTGYLGFVTSKYPMTNPNFRRAVAMAIDRNRLGEILHGGQQAASSFVPPSMLAHSKGLGLPYDPIRAKRELQAAGVDLVRPPTVEIVMPNWDKAVTIGQFIQGELKKNLGITAVLQPFDHKTFRAQLDLHAFALFESSWSADYPDPDNFLSLFLSDTGNNRTTWKNVKYDQLVLKARYHQNAREREKLYLEAQKILQEQEAVVLPLYYEPNMALVRSRVEGLELNPINYLLLRKVMLRD